MAKKDPKHPACSLQLTEDEWNRYQRIPRNFPIGKVFQEVMQQTEPDIFENPERDARQVVFSLLPEQRDALNKMEPYIKRAYLRKCFRVFMERCGLGEGQ